MKFKLLYGVHIDDYGNICKEGDVFESAVDVVKEFNTGTAKKFQKLEDSAPVVRAVKTPPSVSAEQDEDGGLTGGNTSEDQPSGQPSGQPSDQPSSPQEKEELAKLDTMSQRQLTKFAAANEIDLSGAKDKADMVRIIKEAM